MSDRNYYTKDILDEFFKNVNNRFDTQDIKLESIDGKVSYTNGKVAAAIIAIEENKSDANQNWRAIQVATAIFITVVIPLIAIIYYNVTANVTEIKNEVQQLKK